MKTFGLFVVVEASREKVWQGLTAALPQWLAESASGELRPGGAIELKSRIDWVSGTHRVRSVEEREAIVWEWSLDGHPSTVTWRLEDAGEGLTRVRARHDVPDDSPVLARLSDSTCNDMGALHYTWGYALILLKSYAETGIAQCRPRAVESRDAVEWEIEVPAEPARVFDALVDPAQIKGWNPYAGDIVVDKRVGGRYSFGWESEAKGTDGPDEIVELRDGHRIVYGWHGEKNKTLVSWDVEPIADSEGPRARIRFRHSGFAVDPKILAEYKLGWAHFLYAVRELVATGRVTDQWSGRL